jgi:hypothetical protein
MIRVITDLDKSITFETVEEAEKFNADVMESLKEWQEYCNASDDCLKWFIKHSKKYPASEYMMNMAKKIIRARGREDVDKCYEEFMNYEGAGE